MAATRSGRTQDARYDPGTFAEKGWRKSNRALRMQLFAHGKAMTHITARMRRIRYAVLVRGHAAQSFTIESRADFGQHGKGGPMFNSLQEQIRSTEMEQRTVSEQVLRIAGVVAISVVIFGAVYLAIMLLEY